MPEQSKNPFKFWQELKRRKVFRVIAMYAGAAYIIIELVNNVAEPLHLPEWVATFVILLLVIGFPIVAILSWIFDYTPEGWKKTEPARVLQKDAMKPEKRKLKISDGIIVVLLIIVCILLYPKVFKRDKFQDIRDDSGRISLVVMPFQNLSGDTLLDGYELGLQDLLINSLSNSNELSVRHMRTIDYMGNPAQLSQTKITPSFANEFARNLEVHTAIFGSINKSGNQVRIIANLTDTRKNEIYRSFPLEAVFKDNLFELADSISQLIKNFLEIQVIEKGADDDTRLFVQTESAEAYRLFSKGLDIFWTDDWMSAANLFQSALEIDPHMMWARIFLITCYGNSNDYTLAKYLMDSLYKQKDEYNYVDQLYINYFNSLYDKDASESIEMLQKILLENPHSRGMWYESGRFYCDQLNRYDIAIESLEKSLEINLRWGGDWEWISLYTALGGSYHKTGQHEKEQDIYEMGLKISPDNTQIIFMQAICACYQGDTVQLDKYIERYKTICQRQGSGPIWTEFNVGKIYEEAEHYHRAIAIYRHLLSDHPQHQFIKNRLASLLINQKTDVDAGMELIEQVLKNNPENYIALQTKGWGLYQQGHYEESLKFLRKAWDLRPLYDIQHDHQIKEVEKVMGEHSEE